MSQLEGHFIGDRLNGDMIRLMSEGDCRDSKSEGNRISALPPFTRLCVCLVSPFASTPLQGIQISVASFVALGKASFTGPMKDAKLQGHYYDYGDIYLEKKHFKPQIQRLALFQSALQAPWAPRSVQ